MAYTEWAAALKAARFEARLTQREVGAYVGLKARAVSRWEMGQAKPTRRRRAELVRHFTAFFPAVGNQLKARFDEIEQRGRVPAPPPPVAVPLPPSGPAVLELALFKFADELDVPPRRTRVALARLLDRLRAGNLTLDSASQHLAEWLAATG